MIKNMKKEEWSAVENSWDMTTIYDKQGNVVAEIPIYDDELTESELDDAIIRKESIARIITSAPKMLSMLTDIMKCIEGGETYPLHKIKDLI